MQASLSVGDGGAIAEGGSLGQMTYGLNAANGAPATGWPQFSADSVFSTAAVGDLYGTGTDDFVSGGASSQGFAFGTHYADGGQLRIFNDHGGLVCHANTTEQIDSSPAVGPDPPRRCLRDRHRDGQLLGPDQGPASPTTTRSRSTTPTATRCGATTLNGFTGGSPALADVEGNGQLAVVEGTQAGTVYALNAANGSVLWQTNVIGPVYGSVTTANLGAGLPGRHRADDRRHRDPRRADRGRGGPVRRRLRQRRGDNGRSVRVPERPAGHGRPQRDHRHHRGRLLRHLLRPLRRRPGHRPALRGIGLERVQVNVPGGWPQFHHDAQLTGFVGGGATPGSCNRPAAALSGYLTVASDGGIFGFGQDFCGSTGSLTLNKPVVGMAMTPGQGGYWLVASDGGVFSYGDAQFYGSTGSLTLNKPVVGMAATPDGRGYWLVASDGGIFSFGDAQFYGSAASVPNQDIVGMAASPDGQGYWEVSTTGRVFVFGDAIFAGDTSALHLNGFIVGMAADPVTGGYWLIGLRRRRLLLRRPVLRLDRRHRPQPAGRGHAGHQGRRRLLVRGLRRRDLRLRRRALPRLHGRPTAQPADGRDGRLLTP